jgi:hypothetical protein
MGGRISNKVSPMKEYGRKPYLVTPTTVPLGEEADYRYMMDKTWQKAQDDAHIVVQSVKKKPYQEQDYQSMENTADGYTNIDWHFNGKWYRPKPNWRFGKTNTVEPIPPTDPVREEERRVDGVLKWVQCPTTVSASKSYTIIVRNSYRITLQYTNGRLRNTQTETIPTQISLVPKTSEAKGLSIAYVKDMGGSTRATLQTTSYATGEFYVYATDGQNTINKTISVTSKASTLVFHRSKSPYYYKLDDLVLGNETPYSVFTAQSGVLLTAMGGYTSPAPLSYTQESYVSYYRRVYNQGLYLSDATLLTSFDYYEDVYIDASGSVYYISYHGKQADVNYPITLNNYVKTYDLTTNTETYAGYVYYFKFLGVPLITRNGDFSGVTVDEGGVTSYNETGTLMLGVYYIDSNSYVELGDYISYFGTGTPQSSYQVCSGIFGGSTFSFTTDWKATVQFGSL